MDKKNSILRIAITAIALAVAALHAAAPQLVVDTVTIVLLAVAALPWLQPVFKSIELMGVKFELQELQKEMRRVDKKVELIDDKALLPGRKVPTKIDPKPPATPPPAAAAPGAPRQEAEQDEDDSWWADPNRGKFGNSNEANGRILEAKLSPAGSARSAATDIALSVKATDPGRALRGKVRFFLHPTFGRYKEYDVDVKNGVAGDEITSWGRFTVGAIADDGKTKLELDLGKVPGGPPKFYEQ